MITLTWLTSFLKWIYEKNQQLKWSNIILLTFSGADLNALVREASVAALKEFMSNRHEQQATPFTPSTSTQQQGGDDSVTPSILHTPKAVCIQPKHTEIAFQKVTPSVSEKVKFLYLVSLLHWLMSKWPEIR